MNYEFPVDLAKQVREKWTTIIGGEYTPPPLPSDQQVQTLLKVAYLAGMETDKARHLKFTLCCTHNIDNIRRQFEDKFVEAWPFVSDRSFDVQEVRRLASVANLDISAIWVRYLEKYEKSLAIHGLLNMGPSWANARNAFKYNYETLPDALLVRVLAPGRVVVYQGQYLIASLQSGKIQKDDIYTPLGLLGLNPLFREGQDLLRSEITKPIHENLREWHEFERLAYVNTILAIVNSVQLLGHGGAVIFASRNCKFIEGKNVKIKYRFPIETTYLKKYFIRFMTLRHQLGDMEWLTQAKDNNAPTEAEMKLIDHSTQEAERKLVETCEFIGGISGTDGAIILKTDLSIEGFGTEILLEQAKCSKVFKVSGQMGTTKEIKELLDIEHFGMRHRSAMRLCSAVPDLAVFVISQDGGVSLIWNEKGETFFKQGLKTTNINMILA